MPSVRVKKSGIAAYIYNLCTGGQGRDRWILGVHVCMREEREIGKGGNSE